MLLKHTSMLDKMTHMKSTYMLLRLHICYIYETTSMLFKHASMLDKMTYMNSAYMLIRLHICSIHETAYILLNLHM